MNKTRQALPIITFCLTTAALVASRAIASPFAEASKSVVQLTSQGTSLGHPAAVTDSATGVVITLPEGERCVLASSRCLTSSTSVTVCFGKDGRFIRTSAALVGRDPSTDVVILDADEIDTPAASLADVPCPEIGEKLYLVAVGPSGALEFAESIVTETDLHDVGVIRYERLTRVSSPQQVRVGSAAFDESGKLFGFVVHKTLTAEPRPVTYVYVNPVSVWPTTIKRLRESGEIARPWLGLLLVQERDDRDNKSGARVKKVLPDSPASRAGVQVGDVIVGYEHAGSQSIVSCITDLTFAIAHLEPGASITLSVARGEGRLLLPVLLEVMPERYISGSPTSDIPISEHVIFPSLAQGSVRRRALSLSVKGPLADVAREVYRLTGKPVHIHREVDPATIISLGILTNDPTAIERDFARALDALGLSAEITDEVIKVRKKE